MENVVRFSKMNPMRASPLPCVLCVALPYASVSFLGGGGLFFPPEGRGVLEALNGDSFFVLK